MSRGYIKSHPSWSMNDERHTIDFFVSSKNIKETEGVENIMV